MTAAFQTLLKRPWIWSFVGAGVVWLAAIAFTGGYGAGGMLTAALSLSVFTVIVGVGQMFVITLGPGNVDLSLPANIGLASAVAMKTMGGDDRLLAVGLAAAIACGVAVGLANYLLIWALRIPPIIATLSASFIIQSVDISYGRGLQIKPPPGFADFTNIVIAGVPLLAILTVLFTIGASIALHRTIWGRSVVGIGQNQRAARLAGLKVEPVRCATYALCGALGGLNGALLAGYFRGANVDIGNEYLLASIAVVVIGGTSVSGGRANLPGVWGGALFLVLLLDHAQHLRRQRRRAPASDRAHHRRGHNRGGRREAGAVRARARRFSADKRNERRHARRVSGVSLAELAAHDGLLEPELAPKGARREGDGEHAAPFPDRQRGSGEGDENAGVDRMADPSVRVRRRSAHGRA